MTRTPAAASGEPSLPLAGDLNGPPRRRPVVLMLLLGTAAAAALAWFEDPTAGELHFRLGYHRWAVIIALACGAAAAAAAPPVARAVLAGGGRVAAASPSPPPFTWPSPPTFKAGTCSPRRTTSRAT